MSTTYRIATVARRTGLTADTIRAWERRYGMVTPERMASGERRYTEGDVARLELVRAAVSRGYALPDLARLSDAQIRTALQESAGSGAPASALETSAAHRTIQAILESVSSYDLSSAESLLNSAAVFFSPSELIVDVLAPLMHDVGERWEHGRFAIAQEHFTSHLVRNVVGSLLRIHRPAGEPALLFLTPPNEPHELGILFAAALAASKGLRAVVLGANVPVQQAVAAARGTAAARIVVGLTYPDDLSAAMGYLADLRTAIPSSTALCLGGRVAQALDPSTLPDGITVTTTLAAFDASLREMRA